MRSLIFTCPSTALSVQALVDEDLVGPNTMYIPLDCPICKRSHMIEVATCTRPDNKKTDE
jgi:hypothetical protein